MMRRWWLALLLGCLASGAENPIHWSIESTPTKAVHPGARFSVKLSAQIDPGWHLYGIEQGEGGPIATEISLSDDSLLEMGKVRAGKPLQVFDSNFGMNVWLYVDKAQFEIPLTVNASAPAGEQKFVIRTRYQCCNDTMCLPPKTVETTANFEVAAKH